MLKNVFSRCKPAALITVGWMTFIAAHGLRPEWPLSLVLLSIARVLP